MTNAVTPREVTMTDAGQRQRQYRAALERLLAGLTAVRGGDFGTRLPETGDPLLDEIAAAFNGMTAQLDLFTSEVTRVAREVGTEGKLGGQARLPGVSGSWQELTDNVNSMANNLTTQVRNIAQVATAVANGDLTQKIDVSAQGEILELKTTLNTMVDQLSSFAAEVTRVAREVGRDGKLGGQAEVEGVSGTWKRLTENVNDLAGNLTRQVRAISEVARAVAAGDLTRTISVDAEGEVAELKDNINAMVRSLRDMVRASSEQDWLKTNLAAIGSMIQGHRDLKVVANLIMEELAPLVKAQHGTFFLAEDDGGETRLRLIAGYGLRAEADAPAQYRIGQSLIGQVAKSRRPIVVDEVPPGYIRISSGLGEAPPANLAVLPIMFEDQVIGVVELASFTRFTPVQIDFLEQLTSTLGVTVNALIANSRTDALLAESQRLAAELRARSEELQRSNTGLEANAAQLAAQKRDIEAKNAEIERAREEITERARQLALASRYKSQFLANMSHELRTPLNSLLILARLLAQNPDGNLTARQVEYANVIHSAGSDLLQLINDILDLSKVEAGRMDVRAQAFPLGALLDDLRATFGPLTADKGLDFAVTADPSAPRELVTDRQRLRQVLGNLLSNAVKFTGRGQVRVRVSTAPGTPGVACFAVTDTGIGIPPQSLETIFGAFRQGDGTLSRRYGGTGLGLSIASEVAALLGGRITVRSDPGHGSTFTLYLPVALPAGQADPAPPAPRGGPLAAPAPQAVPAATAGQQVLVLERTSGGLLTLLAHSAVSDLAGEPGAAGVRTAVTAGEALAALATGMFCCAVVDVAMPDAADFTERLARTPGLRDLPVLAHAGHRAGAAGEQLAAPPAHLAFERLPTLDALRERIAFHLSASGDSACRDSAPVPSPAADGAGDDPGPAAESAAGDGDAPADLAGRKVLVIDDDPRNVFAITSALEQHGMTVTQAGDGQRGIDALLTAPDTELVLMDVMMPGMDGYSAMAAIRQMPGLARLPIIAVTARAMPGDREKSLAAGATDHVAKPVDTEQLIAVIGRVLAPRAPLPGTATA
jgi:signal transduction histidine kinase/CheY-like chemotaxis protein/HAMP domain-containing protein